MTNRDVLNRPVQSCIGLPVSGESGDYEISITTISLRPELVVFLKLGDERKDVTSRFFNGQNVAYPTAENIAKVINAIKRPTEAFSIPMRTAVLIRRAFLPTNPNKMRKAHPDVVVAALDFIQHVREEGV